MQEGLHNSNTDFSGFKIGTATEAAPVAESIEPLKTEPVKTEATTEPVKTETVNTESKTEPAKIEDADLIKILNERGVTLSSFDEIKNAYTERDTLKQKVDELAKKPLEFPNEKAKALYEFAVKHPGNELSAAKNYLNLVEIDLSKSDAKTKLFEAFALENPKLPRERAKTIFDAQYEQDYGDGNFEGNPLLQFKHEKQVEAAETAIVQAVKAYNEAKAPEPNAGPSKEDIEAEQRILKGIEQSVKDFKEVSLTLSEYQTKIGQTIPQGNLKVALAPEEVAKVREYMENPDKILHEVLLKFNGEALDYNAYRDAVALLLYPQKFDALKQSQYIEQGILAMINQAKNNGREKEPAQERELTKPKTWGQSFDEARAVN